MATRKGKGSDVTAKEIAALRQKAGPRSGFVRMVVYVKPEHLAALQALAKELAAERGAIRPDVSEAARSVLQGWITKR